jgi:hypothetical protein
MLTPDPLAYPPRGMTREEAARYIGMSPRKFDELVADRRMPRPKRVDQMTLWDRVSLDLAFANLPEEKTGLQQRLEKSGKSI